MLMFVHHDVVSILFSFFLVVALRPLFSVLLLLQYMLASVPNIHVLHHSIFVHIQGISDWEMEEEEQHERQRQSMTSVMTTRPRGRATGQKGIVWRQQRR